MDVKRVRLGFDLRIPPETQKENPSQWDQCLLPELCSPISVDPAVWLTTEEVDAFVQDSSWKRVGMELPHLCNPLGLATDFDWFLEVLRKRGISIAGLCPVCLTIYETNLIWWRKHCGPGYFERQPTEEELLSQGWRFRGFDVMDGRGLISGLKGCGYKEPIWSELRHYFGGALNEAGLFSDNAIASRFAEVRGIEIRDHAPFVVVGMLTQDVLGG